MPVILRELQAITGKPLSPAELAGVMEDPRCARLLFNTAKRLSAALINVVNTLDPQCIIIGHEGSYLPDPLLEELERTVNRGMLSSGYQKVTVCRSAYGTRSPRLGSVGLVFDRLFAGRFHSPEREGDGSAAPTETE